ncbi:hypothetical protein [Aurantiacibacter suaedae]|uniref:hypothetical protein n=1 Tax=Aurantiacibacter suaedae TaxID=2545755 RepID=UPI0010F5F840|nr:hypothetical protein [Aurantiacibacter suaedae]
MTVCVAVKVHDCIVFAADSASSLIGGAAADGRPLIENVYAHGNKVFNLKKGLPIAAMTCGMGNIGQVSISTLAKDLRSLFCSDDPVWKLDPESYTIESVAIQSRKFFFDECYCKLPDRPAGPHEFQFWIAGNSSGQTHGEIWRIRIIDGDSPEPELLASEGDFDILYDGQPEAINRIVNGYSQFLPSALLKIGLPENELDSVLAHIEAATYARLISPAMPVQDAIALADFLVETTKGYVRFLPGADTVGGDTDICVVTKHEGFKWVRRKHYFDKTLNPTEANYG